MFLIWRGWGLLLPLGVFAGAFIGFLVSGSLLGPQSGFAPVIISLFATIGAYGVVALLGRTDKGKVVIDKDSGEELLLKRGDSLFFIPVRFWFYLLVIITVVALGISVFSLFAG
ncbi:hypothetical protein SAMN04488056_11193 [Cohaesibacter marisflavi]|uniref:Uncharacterized protein n=1 Tax=Cohaesibacter marisflavi TaxID=655353 RepID=A0A1I5JD02_9HYPH|nr:hypothetical protein [Cohaesibacter marisflavi]SFO70728.1 hypothetical protein SAMN04488056_11193 [Cohaesibacter marisflavi]